MGMDSKESCLYEPLTKKPKKLKKKKKSGELNEDTLRESVTTDVMVSPIPEEVENEATRKKKSKKKKNERFGLPDESAIEPTISTEPVAPSSDGEGNNEVVNRKNKKKKKRKLDDVGEEVAIINDDVPAPSNDAEMTSSHVKKKKKKKDKPEHSFAETSVVSLVSSDAEHGAESSHAKKKKKKRDRPEETSEEISAPAVMSSDTNQEINEEAVAKKKKQKDNTEEVTVTPDVLSVVERDTEPGSECPRRKSKKRRNEEDSSSSIVPPNWEKYALDEASLKAVRDCGVSPGEVPFLRHLPKEPVCPYCDKHLKNVKYRNIHIRVVHLKERRFQCDVCEVRFGDRSTLRVHTRVHRGERNYDCPYCPEKFRNGKNLKRHVRSHWRMVDGGLEPTIELGGQSQTRRKPKPTKEKTPDKEVVEVKELPEEEADEIVERLVALSKDQGLGQTS